MPHRDAHAELAAVASTRWRIAVALTALMLVTYFGFILLAAFARGAMGAQIVPGLSVGIALGAAVIVCSWLFTGLYVRWANGRYDDAVRAAREAGPR
jgi:uncharacterized membrane protein (DUF485 family)